MLGLAELLKHRGLDLSKKIKIVRHQDKRYSVQLLMEKGQLEVYQSYQSKPILDCDYVISTIGDESSKAFFYGVYRVCGKKKGNEEELPTDFIYQDFTTKGFYYDLVKIDGFDDLSRRVIIEWGKAALAWHQWFSDKNDKMIVEILPEGYVKEFPGFNDFTLSFRELEGIIKNPDSNKEWKRMLSSVAGIYLILDKQTGNQYIGSAYGEKGIWGRWSNYIATGDGGNNKLEELVKENEGYKYNFQFSLLMTLPITMTPKETINHEVIFKNKLGSRAFGLNSN